MNDIELSDYVALKLPDHTVMLADGFSEACVGIGWQCDKPRLCYDKDKCVEILVKRDSMSVEDAEHFFHDDVLGSYVGDSTPLFLTKLE